MKIISTLLKSRFKFVFHDLRLSRAEKSEIVDKISPRSKEYENKNLIFIEF